MNPLELDRVTVRLGGRTVLDDVSLSVGAGELLPILGPSGCGKTTLLRVVAGLVRPKRGRVTLGERVFNDPRPRVPAHERGVAMVFQQLALWPHLTVARNLSFGLEARKVPEAERTTRVADALASVDLAGFEARRPDELSGGERQRVALARALVANPDVLLLDEPLSSVDAMLRDELLSVIRTVHRRLGVTTLYVTHDRDEAMALGRRVAVMTDGRLVQVDAPEALHRRPANRFVARVSGVQNVFFAVGEDDAMRPVPDADPDGPAPNGARLVAIGGHDLELADADDAPIEGEVEASVFRGDHVVVIVRTGVLRLEVRDAARRDVGERIGVRWLRPPVPIGSDSEVNA